MKDSFLPGLPSLLFLYYLEVNRSGTVRESYDYNFPGKSNFDIFFLLKKEEFGKSIDGKFKKKVRS
jgi:hypothetical protein